MPSVGNRYDIAMLQFGDSTEGADPQCSNGVFIYPIEVNQPIGPIHPAHVAAGYPSIRSPIHERVRVV